jgi:hypothetical protein
MTIPTSPRLLALLQHAKGINPDMTWKAIPKALEPIFYSDMSLIDAMHHIVAAFEEVLSEPRFEVGRHGASALELLMSPIKGFSAIDVLGPKTLETTYTVEQFYNSMAMYIFSQLRISRVDWMEDTLKGT